MQASKLPNPMYKCNSCSNVYAGTPEMEPVLDPEDLDQGEYYTFDQAFEEGGRYRWKCEGGCGPILSKDCDYLGHPTVKIYFTIYNPAWKCGGCNEIYADVQNAMKCCL